MALNDSVIEWVLREAWSTARLELERTGYDDRTTIEVCEYEVASRVADLLFDLLFSYGSKPGMLVSELRDQLHVLGQEAAEAVIGRVN